MPALVASQRLHDVVIGLGVDAAARADVRDRRGLELEIAEPARRTRPARRRVRNWPGKIRSACSSHVAWRLVPCRIVEVGDADAAHDRSERRVEWFDLHCAHPQGRSLFNVPSRSRRRSNGRGTRSSAKASTSTLAYCSFRPLVVPMNRRRVTSIGSSRCAGCFCSVRSFPSCPCAAMTCSTPTGPNAADELVFEVLVAHEEAERFEIVAAERSPEDPFLTDVVQTLRGGRSEPRRRTK